MTTKDITITARIRGDLDRRLSTLADALGRSKSWVVGTALESYVANETQYLEAVRQGLADLEGGRIVPHSQVRTDFERRKRRRARRR